MSHDPDHDADATSGPAGSARPIVVQSEDLDDHARAWLDERCDVRAVRFDSGEPFERVLAVAEAMVVRTYTRVDGALLAKAPKLRVVGRAGVGLDRIDVAACRRRGVEVVHTPLANIQAVAEYVFALLHDATRPRLVLDGAVSVQRWNEIRRELEAPRQLSEITLGVLGLGKIGSRVARIARGYGMRVVYHDVLTIADAGRYGAVPVSRDELLASSDVLTIHVDGRSENRGLLGRDAFDIMKPDAVLINTSRGFVIDPPALAAYLRANPRAQALLDVHEPEPFGPSYPLLDLPNAHLMPHLAASTATAHSNMSWVVRDVWRVLKGQSPEHPAPQSPAP